MEADYALNRIHGSGLVSLALIALSCAGSDTGPTDCVGARQIVDIHVSDLPVLTEKLRICLKAGDVILRGGCRTGQVVPELAETNGSGDVKVQLNIPQLDGTSTLSLYVEALDHDECIRGVANEPNYDLSGAGQPIPLQVAPNSPRLCPLVVEDSTGGSASVVSPVVAADQLPANYCVGAYVARFPDGTNVTIQPQANPNYHFNGWNASCKLSNAADVRGACSVTINGKTVVKPQYVPGICSFPDTCWEHPLPHGVTLNGIWGSVGASGLRLTTVGEAGSIFEGAVSLQGGQASVEWSAMQPSKLDLSLRAVGGADSDNVWAVGDAGTIFRRNGGSWTQQTAVDGTMMPLLADWKAVAALSATNAWAAGSSSTFVHWNGAAWQQYNAPALPGSIHQLWLPGGGEVYAAGDNATLWIYDTIKWQDPTLSMPSTYMLCTDASQMLSLWSSDQTTAWLAGATGSILRYSQQAGCVRERSADTVALQAIFGFPGSASSDAPLWAVGSDLDARTMARIPTILRRGVGQTWSQDDVSNPDYVVAPNASKSLNGMWGQPGYGIWAVGSDGLTTRHLSGADDAQNWVIATLPQDTIALGRRTLRGAFGANGEAWAVGDVGMILHFDGKLWTNETIPSMLSQQISANDMYGVWADASELWIVGSGATILTRKLADPQSWRAIPPPADVDPANPPTLYAVSGDAQHIVIVGSKGFRYVVDRSAPPALTRCPNDTDTNDYYSVWVGPDGYAAGSAKQMFANNTNTAIYYFDCRPYLAEDTPFPQNTIRSLWGSAVDDLWAAGDSLVAHRKLNPLTSKVEWVTAYLDPSDALYGGGSYAGGAIVGGRGGRIITLANDTTYKVFSIGRSSVFRSVWSPGPGQVLLVGDSGAIVRYFP